VLGAVTQDPTSSQKEREDMFKNALGEFTRMNRIQFNPFPAELGVLTQDPTSSQEEHKDVFKNALGEFTKMN
jgi:hypothetical protein